jgi:Na+/H+ antiporter NhaD/arsenite permease-like protein
MSRRSMPRCLAAVVLVIATIAALPAGARGRAPGQPDPRSRRAALALGVLMLMVLLFIFGEALPVPIVAPEVAILGATLALLVIYQLRIEGVETVLNSVDWKTLLFIGAIFCLVQAFTETGLLQGMALRLHDLFGTHFTLVALVLLAAIGVLSSVLANIPVVAASLVMTKGYLVAAQRAVRRICSAAAGLIACQRSGSIDNYGSTGHEREEGRYQGRDETGRRQAEAQGIRQATGEAPHRAGQAAGVGAEDRRQGVRGVRGP